MSYGRTPAGPMYVDKNDPGHTVVSPADTEVMATSVDAALRTLGGADESINRRLSAVESINGTAPDAPSDGVVASLLSQPDTQTGEAADARARTRTRAVYPEDFGAVGDGVVDDTGALQAWLASSHRHLRMGGGDYRTTAGLESTLADRTIWSDGGWIKCEAAEAVALTITGARTRARLCIDGRSTARVGVMVNAGGCDLSGSVVTDCRSTTSTAAGIWASTTAGFRCVGATVERIHSVGNSTTGDSNGAARGIYLGLSLDVATKPSLIEGNIITDVTGEEGDSIQIIATVADTTQPFGSMLATVRGNIITNFSRRAIKVQASDCTITDNECTDMSPTLAGTEHRVIYVLNSDGSVVERNRVHVVRNFASGISVTNETPVRYGRRTVVRDNISRVDATDTGTAIIVASHDGAIVTGNRTYGSATGFYVTRLTGSVVEDNAGADSPKPLFIADAVTGTRLARNHGLGSTSGPIQVDAVDTRRYALTRTMDAPAVASNFTHRVRWTNLEGEAATVSDGFVTPEPGRYLMHAAVAGTPVNASGYIYLQIATDPETVVRYTRLAISSTQLQTWETSAVVTVGTGARLWVNIYHTNGADLPLDGTARLPLLSLERLD